MSYDKKSPFSRNAAHILFLFPLETSLRLSRNMLHGWKDNTMLAKPRSMHLSIFNSFRVRRCLSQCVSPKIAFFTSRSPHFCFSWRRPCDYHAICCMDGKIIQCLPNPLQHVSTCLQQFPSYSNRKCQKFAVFTYRSPHFCFPLKRPCVYHAICCTDGKTIQCLPNPLQHVPTYIQ